MCNAWFSPQWALLFGLSRNLFLIMQSACYILWKVQIFAQSMLCSVQRSNRYFARKPMDCAVIVQPMDCCWCLYNRMTAIPFKALLIIKCKQLSIEPKYMHGTSSVIIWYKNISWIVLNHKKFSHENLSNKLIYETNFLSYMRRWRCTRHVWSTPTNNSLNNSTW